MGLSIVQPPKYGQALLILLQKNKEKKKFTVKLGDKHFIKHVKALQVIYEIN